METISNKKVIVDFGRLELEVGGIYNAKIFNSFECVIEIVGIIEKNRYPLTCLLPKNQPCGIVAYNHHRRNSLDIPLVKQLQHKIYCLEIAEIISRVKAKW